MKKITKVLMALALSACMAFGAMGIVACTSQQGKSAYEISVEHGFEGTEEEWLESLKANTPDIKIGENGNWYINGIDTGIKATGADGAKGDEGDKGDQGEPGKQGDTGARGSIWITGEGDPEDLEALEGDMYLDILTGNIWQMGEESWELKMCLKGEIDDGSVDLGSHTLKANEAKEIDIDVEAGNYTLTVTLESGNTLVQGGLMAKVGDFNVSYDLFEATNNVYTGVLIIKDGDDKITLTATEDMTVSLSFKEWKSPVLKADGQIYIIPEISVYDSSESRCLPISIDPALFGGTYKITVYNETSTVCQIFDSANNERLVALRQKNGFTAEITFDSSNPTLCFQSNHMLFDYNIAVKIESL